MYHNPDNKEYCDSSCESMHIYKLEKKEKRKTKSKMLSNKVEELENRIAILEKRIGDAKFDELSSKYVDQTSRLI